MSNFQKLSNTEMMLMQMIWLIEHPVKSSELIALFSKNDEWKEKTVVTILANLVEKGILIAKKQGQANMYIPCISPEEFRKMEV